MNLKLSFTWAGLAVLFLILYYAVWSRYFTGGREIALLNRAFLLVPMPLAVFPVLYVLRAAVWPRNLPAAVVMLISAQRISRCRFNRFNREGKR